MIKKILFSTLLILLHSVVFFRAAHAQTSYKGLGADNSTFLLGATNARKSQCLYKPTDFTSIPFNGEITRIYYRYGTTAISAPHDLSPFTIKLGQTNDSIFPPGDTFFTGLTTVRYDSVYTITEGVAGNWFGIDLQTPFTYDSSKTLIVEIQFYTSTATSFGTLGNTNTTQKLISSDTASLTQIGFGSTTWQDFGFDYLVSTGLAKLTTGTDVVVFPNPTNDLIHIANSGATEDATISVYDVLGKVVYTAKYAHHSNAITIDLNQIASGSYTLKIASEQVQITKKIIKL